MEVVKKLYGGTLGTSSATLVTVGTGKTAIVKEIILCNKTATDATATIVIDGVTIIGATTITKNTTYIVELRTVVEATKLITGLAGTGSAIDVNISGIELS